MFLCGTHLKDCAYDPHLFKAWGVCELCQIEGKELFQDIYECYHERTLGLIQTSIPDVVQEFVTLKVDALRKQVEAALNEMNSRLQCECPDAQYRSLEHISLDE